MNIQVTKLTALLKYFDLLQDFLAKLLNNLTTLLEVLNLSPAILKSFDFSLLPLVVERSIYLKKPHSGNDIAVVNNKL